MKKLIVFILFLSVVFTVFADLRVGDTVLAFWDTTENYYVGTIVEINNTIKGGGYLVIFRDGDQAVVSSVKIKPMDLTVGSKVMALWTDGYMYPGTINRIVGEALFIQFDDGDTGWTSWAGIAFE